MTVPARLNRLPTVTEVRKRRKAERQTNADLADTASLTLHLLSLLDEDAWRIVLEEQLARALGRPYTLEEQVDRLCRLLAAQPESEPKQRAVERLCAFVAELARKEFAGQETSP